MTELERTFTVEMRDLYHRIISATSRTYRPTGLLELVSKGGGVAAALNLVHRSSPSPGYGRLYELGLLDLTVEALILQSPWAELFDRDVLVIARNRLSQYEFHFPEDYWRPDA